MTENMKQLISQVVYRGVNKHTYEFIKCLIDNDKTDKDKSFRDNILRELSKLNNFELTEKQKGLVYYQEKVRFKDYRYIMTDSTTSLLGEIIKRYKTKEKLLSEYDINFPLSILISGKTGTGKTEFCKKVAYTLELPFVYCNISQLVDSYMGETGRNIKEIFDIAINHKCLLVIDELDCLATARHKGSSTKAEDNRITASLLGNFDRFTDCDSKSIIIACTNAKESIDTAVQRRFNIQSEIRPIESDKELKYFIDKYIESLGVENKLGDFSNIKVPVQQYDIVNNINKRLIDIVDSEMG